MASVSVRAWEEAVRFAGAEPPPRVRPNPLLWLKYVVWGPLPERYAGWVLFDTTCRTWAARHFGRLAVIVALPVAAFALWLPASGGIRALIAVTTGLCAVLLPGLYVNEATDFRLVQAGYPASVGPRIREARALYGQRLANAIRRERAAERKTHRAA